MEPKHRPLAIYIQATHTLSPEIITIFDFRVNEYLDHLDRESIVWVKGGYFRKLSRDREPGRENKNEQAGCRLCLNRDEVVKSRYTFNIFHFTVIGYCYGDLSLVKLE